jgi:hypothetical protein
MEIPPDIAVEMSVSSASTSRSSQRRNGEIGHTGELSGGFKSGTRAATSNYEKGTGIHMDLGNIAPAGPPDLMQSVEDVYRSFISDGRRTSHSNVLPTPRAEVGGFHFSSDEWEKRGRISPGGYAAHHAKRFAELGYCQSPHFVISIC